MERIEPRADADLPVISLASIGVFLLAWLMMFAEPAFPAAIPIALACIASPFVVGFFACLLYRQRFASRTARVAYFASIGYLAAVLAGFGAGEFLRDYLPRRRLTGAALTGTYRPDAKTRAFFEHELHLPAADTRLELRRDWTCTLTNVPFFRGYDELPAALVSGSGEWWIDSGVVLQPAPSTWTASAWRNELHLIVAGWSAPYRLKIPIGDSDADTVIFVKEQ